MFSAAPFLPFAGAAALAFSAGGLAGLLPSARPRDPAPQPSPIEGEGERRRSTILGDIGEGFGWVNRQEDLRRLAVITAVVGLTDSAWFGILVLYAIRIVHLGPAGYGLMLAAGGLGGVVGGITAGRMARWLSVPGALMLSVLAMGATQALLGLTSSALVAFTALSLSSGAIAVFNALAVSTRQRLTPAALLGRINSVFRFLGLGAAPLGAAIGGFLATSVDLRAPFLAGAPLVLLAGLGLRLRLRASSQR
jgi:predicted MFS family arabinose efflux permease